MAIADVGADADVDGPRLKKQDPLLGSRRDVARVGDRIAAGRAQLYHRAWQQGHRASL